ncbi:MAG TPA: hypothetical protein PL001_02845 [Candidatus Kryptobacter bacterium]|nr:hypothetical protein [Candidatus Kryptobacter bacterium]
MKKLIFALVMLCLVVAGVASAETARLGKDYGPAFNQTASVAKTAAYTLTASDSLVNFSLASADYAATLPAISSFSGESKSYKIVKTDATAYVLTVTPATGDTIGGESTRKLISDDSYMIITSGPGKNWTITYETPYIVEDHKAGTYTTGIGSGGLFSTLTVSTTLTASACGNVYTAATGTLTINLPSTVANCKIKIINNAAPYSQIINPADADAIFGSCTLASSVVTIAGAVGDSVTNTTATAVKGDWIELTGSGVAASGWWITGCQGIWADTN